MRAVNFIAVILCGAALLAHDGDHGHLNATTGLGHWLAEHSGLLAITAAVSVAVAMRWYASRRRQVVPVAADHDEA